MTDAQGRYSIALDHPGPAELSYGFTRGQTSISQTRQIVLKAGQNVYNQQLPSGRVSGRVVDPQTGQGFEGEIIEAWAKS